MVRAQSGTSRSPTSAEHRYSLGDRSKASWSAVVPRSRAASSYRARAWPISFWAIDENATSSSRSGAIPVHSESRQPMTSSSSASSSRRSFTRFLELRLERVPVDAVVGAAELVHEVVQLVDRVARDEPERGRFLSPPVLLARVHLRELLVRRADRARVLERLALPLLTKNFVDHAASASTTCRTQAE